MLSSDLIKFSGEKVELCLKDGLYPLNDLCGIFACDHLGFDYFCLRICAGCSILLHADDIISIRAAPTN